MAMSDDEIDRLIEKLKQKYADYSAKNPTWFNYDAFRDRLLVAVKNRMNREAFILAEIANFEKTREKYEKKKSQKSFSEQVDRIIDEQTARIKKYPCAHKNHPSARFVFSPGEQYHSKKLLKKPREYVPGCRIRLNKNI